MSAGIAGNQFSMHLEKVVHFGYIQREDLTQAD